ncbi:hypothetical protein A2U01_0021919, partial [Trifolium medium]|nr:hypothetical protein [Trifolium medium]
MVILRDLNDGEENFSKPLPIGSDLERQIRAHFTRADGSLNRRDYYSELWGFPVSSSNSEGSGDSDSDSSSGASSDCVIISPSSFTGKQGSSSRSLAIVEFDIMSMEVSSKFTSSEIVTCFREAVKLSGSNNEDHIVTEPVRLDEFVTEVKSEEPHHFYMYTSVLQVLNIWLPLTSFEGTMLRLLNVAPCQLHPNSWAFIKAFEVVCLGFE